MVKVLKDTIFVQSRAIPCKLISEPARHIHIRMRKCLLAVARHAVELFTREVHANCDYQPSARVESISKYLLRVAEVASNLVVDGPAVGRLRRFVISPEIIYLK